MSLWRDAIGVFYNPCQLGQLQTVKREFLWWSGKPADIIGSDSEFQSCYYIYFRIYTLWKGMNPLIPAIYGLNSITTVLLKERLLLHLDTWPICQLEILYTGRTGENKRKQSRSWTEVCGCYEKIYEKPTWDTGSVSQSQLLTRRYSASGWAPYWSQEMTAGLWLSTLRPRSRRRAKWGFGDNTAWEEEVNMAVCLHLPPSVWLSGTTEASTPRRNKEIYIFITKSCGSSFITGIQHLDFK